MADDENPRFCKKNREQITNYLNNQTIDIVKQKN